MFLDRLLINNNIGISLFRLLLLFSALLFVQLAWADGIWCSTQSLSRSSSRHSSTLSSYSQNTPIYQSVKLAGPASSAVRSQSFGSSSVASTAVTPSSMLSSGTKGVSKSWNKETTSGSGKRGQQSLRGQYQSLRLQQDRPQDVALTSSALSGASLSLMRRRVSGGGGEGKVAQSFYNWLYTEHDKNGAYLYEDDTYWYYDMGELQRLYEKWAEDHSGNFGGALPTWEQFLEWFNDYDKQTWFRAPLGDSLWLMILFAILWYCKRLIKNMKNDINA